MSKNSGPTEVGKFFLIPKDHSGVLGSLADVQFFSNGLMISLSPKHGNLDKRPQVPLGKWWWPVVSGTWGDLDFSGKGTSVGEARRESLCRQRNEGTCSDKSLVLLLLSCLVWLEVVSLSTLHLNSSHFSSPMMAAPLNSPELCCQCVSGWPQERAKLTVFKIHALECGVPFLNASWLLGAIPPFPLGQISKPQGSVAARMTSGHNFCIRQVSDGEKLTLTHQAGNAFIANTSP